MQDPSVAKLFREQLDYYARDDQSAAVSPIIPLFLAWFGKNPSKKLKIAEFGGAAGQLLAQIGRTFPKSELTNIELIAGFRNRQILKKINFVQGSILDSKFKDKSFDCLIIRDVLHHLVGKNYQESRNNQKKALQELWRLLKPGGVIFIEELVNRSAIAGRLIYWLSRANSKIGLRFRTFQVSPHTILAFLTPRALLNLAGEVFGKKSLKKVNFIEFNKQWQYRLAHLGASSGKMIITVEKRKSEDSV